MGGKTEERQENMKRIKIIWHKFWIIWHNSLTANCMRWRAFPLMLDQIEKMQWHCDKIWKLNEEESLAEYKRMREMGREEYERQQNEK